MRLSSKELDKAKAEMDKELDNRMKAFREAVHEFVLLEARSRKLLPHQVALMLNEHAAVLVCVASMMRPSPVSALSIYIGQYLRVCGATTHDEDIKRIGEEIQAMVARHD